MTDQQKQFDLAVTYRRPVRGGAPVPLIIAIAVLVVIVALLGTRGWLRALSGACLIVVVPAALTTVLVYGRGYFCTFCLGALFPAGIILLLISPAFLILAMEPRALDDLDWTFVLVIVISWGISVAVGLVALGVRSMMEAPGRRQQWKTMRNRIEAEAIAARFAGPLEDAEQSDDRRRRPGQEVSRETGGAGPPTTAEDDRLPTSGITLAHGLSTLLVATIVMVLVSSIFFAIGQPTRAIAAVSLLIAFPAVLTTMLVHGRGYTQAFSIGALFPAGGVFVPQLGGLGVPSIFGAWMGGDGLSLAIFIASVWGVSFAAGLIACVVRWMVERSRIQQRQAALHQQNPLADGPWGSPARSP